MAAFYLLADIQSENHPGQPLAMTEHMFYPRFMSATEYHRTTCKTAINRVMGMPFNWSLNPYRGCVHACHYCYARATHTFLGLNPDDDFERQIFAKMNIAEALNRDLSRRTWPGESVAIGTATDAYQPIESHLKLTRACLEVFLDHRNPCTVVTKSRLVRRDIDLWQELSKLPHTRVYCTVTTLNEDIWRLAEPGTPSPSERLENLRVLSRAGVRTGVLMAPLLPGITDSEESILSVAEAVANAGAETFSASPLRLDPGVKEHYFAWLAETFPDLLRRYQVSFHDRHLSADYHRRIEAVAVSARDRFGMNTRVERGAEPRIKLKPVLQLALI
jgi:DNA repair photolyase